MTVLTRSLESYIAERRRAGQSSDEAIQELEAMLTPETLRDVRRSWLRREVGRPGERGPAVSADEVFAEMRALIDRLAPEPSKT
jgi:hypothetical protein